MYIYNRVMNGLPPTNNTCEAWNFRFNTLLGRRHPNLHVFLEALLKEEEYSESSRRAIDLGEEPPRKKRKYIRNDVRIERVVRRFQEYKEAQEDVLEGDWDDGILKYLKTLGHSSSRVLM